MKERNLWPLALEAWRTLGGRYSAAMEQAIQVTGVPHPEWYLLLSALMREPEPLTADWLVQHLPYTAAGLYQTRLEKLAQDNFLVPVGDHAYRMTEKGRLAIHRIIQSAYAELETLEPLPPAELEHLAELLNRLVQASLEAPEPANKTRLFASRHIAPPPGSPLMVIIDQLFTDLAAFRDDAHMAVWQPLLGEDLKTGGPAWEALTYLWRGEFRTVRELHQKLERRGFDEHAYAQALQTLDGHGWVVVVEGGYLLTEAGQHLRQKAEEATDALFYAPWAVLTSADQAKMVALLTQFEEGLKEE